MESRRLVASATANARPGASVWALFRNGVFQWMTIGRPTSVYGQSAFGCWLMARSPHPGTSVVVRLFLEKLLGCAFGQYYC